jgi:hypothetical protein
MPQLGLGLGAQINESNSFDPDALRYFTTAGVTDATGRSQINTFVRGIKSLGLYNNMVAWPLRSTQNNSSGTTAYSLGGFGVYNGTLINGPTWGTSGITFDGIDDFIDTALGEVQPELTLISVATTTSAILNGIEIAKDNGSTLREFALTNVNPSTLRFISTGADGTNVSDYSTYSVGVIRFACARMSTSFRRARKNNGSDFSAAGSTRATLALNVRIGTRNPAIQHFPGVIHTSIVFNTALTDSQTSAVYALYQTSLGAGLGLPDADASAYIARAGVTDTTGQQQINDFVVGVKNLGLYNNMVAWPLRSTQNKGSGIIAYSLGGLGTFDGTLTNGPTWGTGGVTFDGVDDYISTAFTSGLSEFTVFSVATPSSGATSFEFSKDDISGKRDFSVFQQTGNIKLLLSNPAVVVYTGASFTASVIRAITARASSSVNKIRKDNGSDTTGAVGTLTTSDTPIRIGAPGSGAVNFFPGVIHGSILFNKALTDSETSSMYTLYSTTLGSGLGLP